LKNSMKLTAIAHRLFKVRSGILPVICIFGGKDIELVTPKREDYEEERLDCRCYSSDAGLERILVQDKPHVLITIGKRSSFPSLLKAPFAIQKRWLHYDALPDLAQLGIDAYNCYVANMYDDGGRDEQPLVSVFTPAYKTQHNIYRPFRSLEEQTYPNWEWIIVDDSDDQGRTFKVLRSLAKKDHRIEVFTPWEHSGVIGRLKHWACSLANGQILVELDHDDELTDYALECVVQGFERFPEAGFLYTDNAEI
jgi:hypothetical protein